MIDATADLFWLHGYRMRASGLPRPPGPDDDTPTEVLEGWDDLDAVLKLIEQALAK